MNKKKTIIIVSSLLVLGYLIFIKNKASKKIESITDDEQPKEKILFLGGLDNRINDKKLSEQENLIKENLNRDIDIESFRYVNVNGILNSIKSNPQSIVILFSAGAKNSSSVANEIIKNKGDLNKMYILEPYNDFKTTYDSVNKAIKLGVPQKNVWIGTTQSTGLGIIINPNKTPFCLPKHWCSLSEIGQKI